MVLLSSTPKLLLSLAPSCNFYAKPNSLIWPNCLFSTFPPVLVCSGCYNKYHIWSLNNRNLLSPSSGGQKPKIKVLAGLVFTEVSFRCLKMAATLLCPDIVSPLICSILYASTTLVCSWNTLISSSYKDTSKIGLGPSLKAEFYLVTSLKSVSKCSHILKVQEFRASRYDF